MPVIKSAKKKLRQDKKRTKLNKERKNIMKSAIKTARMNPTDETVRLAVQASDKAVKHYIIHKNKAARIKSMLSKLLSGEKKAGIEAPAKKAKKKKVIKKTVTPKKK